SLALTGVLAAFAIGSAAAQSGDRVAARHLARADSAYRAGDAALAAGEYAATLELDPDNSKATFRLAQLQRSEPAEAERLFRRYVDLEPADPWGYMALGDQLARRGRYSAALEQYDHALSLAPNERDAVVGRARVLARAGRTERAIGEYQHWVGVHADDAEALRELARELSRAGRHRAAVRALEGSLRIEPNAGTTRRLALERALLAPALEPALSNSRDSDGNVSLKLGLTGDWTAGDRGRVGFGAARRQVADGIDRVRMVEVSGHAITRPVAQLRVEALAGGAVLDPSGQAATEFVVPTGRIRARWRGAAGQPSFEARVSRAPLDASPTLIAGRVVRSEIGGTLDLPVAGPLRFRGTGRVADLRDRLSGNTRTAAAGMVVFAAGPAVEVSGQFHQIAYAHGTTAGYFAPRLIQVAQLGSYAELERGSVTAALDLSVGVQRLAEQGAAVGSWRRAFGLYSLISWTLRPGTELRFELEAYDAPAAIAGVTTGAAWRFGSFVTSLRWSL
ncbi:MAG: tetratricopeptide repeat protein, partial [Gemmatimonadetes bacterium]|nr:tetratricopeptide repeat protein [Gemmatimonadota bacterium]